MIAAITMSGQYASGMVERFKSAEGILGKEEYR
jgi:hypothetical protein